MEKSQGIGTLPDEGIVTQTLSFSLAWERQLWIVKDERHEEVSQKKGEALNKKAER